MRVSFEHSLSSDVLLYGPPVYLPCVSKVIYGVWWNESIFCSLTCFKKRLFIMDSKLEDVIVQLSNDIKNLISSHNDLKKEVQATSKAATTAASSISSLTEKQLKMETFVEKFVRQERSKNIIMFNLEFSVEEKENLFDRILSVFLGVGLSVPDVALVDAYRLGKDKAKCLVIIKFISTRWVRLIFTKISQLRELGIVIANDRSPEERERRRTLGIRDR